MTATPASQPPLDILRTGNGVFTYRTAGEPGARTLVLLHGIGSGSGSWSTQLRSLSAQEWRVVAWDAPGYGGSSNLQMPDPRTVDYAAALDDFVDALGIARFCLLGHSLGAMMAASYGRSRAPRVEKLVLASPAIGYGAATEEVRHARTDGRLVDLDRYGPAGIAERRAHALLSPQATPEAVARVRAVMSQIRPDGYRQAVGMLAHGDILADGHAVSLPTLVLCGSADTVTPEEGCRRVAASVPGARYETLPGLGHASYVENADLFDDAVLRFFASTGAS